MRRGYSAEQIERDPACEPPRMGWRRGGCSRERSREVRALAHELTGQIGPRWRIALMTPRHGTLDDCLECEALLVAREIVLARPKLTRAELDALGSRRAARLA
jgi:hypothetical protein